MSRSFENPLPEKLSARELGPHPLAEEGVQGAYGARETATSPKRTHLACGTVEPKLTEAEVANLLSNLGLNPNICLGPPLPRDTIDKKPQK